jgi:hypothetical protein
MAVLWIVAQRSLVEVNRSFRGACPDGGSKHP